MTQERKDVHEAILAVRDKALSEVQTVEKKAKRQVETLVKESVEVGKMRAEAIGLGELIKKSYTMKHSYCIIKMISKKGFCVICPIF